MNGRIIDIERKAQRHECAAREAVPGGMYITKAIGDTWVAYDGEYYHEVLFCPYCGDLLPVPAPPIT